ncbi:TPA: hypothetical protein EYP83_00140 [Candidatus Geothermarchaeota archaeon]|nr:hypothetical protein [Candidatus Geothermarchaeota archaeon]HIQ13247.1 hypothetical protein [Thermoprotei archaeon]
MNGSNIPIYIRFPSGKIVSVDRWISFNGTLENIDCYKYLYPLGYGLGLFHDPPDKIECIISFSGYNLIRWIDGTYVKVYAGATYIDLIRTMAIHKKLLTIFYPPNPLESIGGLLAQGYGIFNHFNDEYAMAHIYLDNGEKQFTSLKDVKKSLLVDIHIYKPKSIKSLTPAILTTKLTQKEAEYFLKLVSEHDISYSIIKDRHFYKLASLIYDRVLYRLLKNILLSFLTNDRLIINDLLNLTSQDLPFIYPINRRIYLGTYHDILLDDILFLQRPSNLSITVNKAILDKVYKGSVYNG